MSVPKRVVNFVPIQLCTMFSIWAPGGERGRKRQKWKASFHGKNVPQGQYCQNKVMTMLSLKIQQGFCASLSNNIKKVGVERGQRRVYIE